MLVLCFSLPFFCQNICCKTGRKYNDQEKRKTNEQLKAVRTKVFFSKVYYNRAIGYVFSFPFVPLFFFAYFFLFPSIYVFFSWVKPKPKTKVTKKEKSVEQKYIY